jgi:cytochrome c-type biogenesis protein
MFGIDIIDAAFLPAAFVALFAGVLSFLSPCILPIVPPYLAYISGISVTDMSDKNSSNSAFLPALFFVFGLSTVFLLLGFTASALGAAFLAYQETLSFFAALLVMTFGAHFIGIFRIRFLDREARFETATEGGSAFGAYILGLAFAFGWTPCIGPQLASILTLAASESSLIKGTLLLGIYAIGLGFPFLIVAAFLNRLTGLLSWFKRHMQQIERTMGLLLWTIGLLMLTGGFADISFWLLDTFPILAILG